METSGNTQLHKSIKALSRRIPNCSLYDGFLKMMPNMAKNRNLSLVLPSSSQCHS